MATSSDWRAATSSRGRSSASARPCSTCSTRRASSPPSLRRLAFKSLQTLMPTAQSPLGWLGVYSEANLRAALRSATPDLADLPITLHRLPDLDNANWASCRATVGARVFAKFAFSERTAVRIWREAQVLGVLDADLGLAVPKLVAANRNPAFVATELVDGGVPLTYADVVAAVPD